MPASRVPGSGNRRADSYLAAPPAHPREPRRSWRRFLRHCDITNLGEAVLDMDRLQAVSRSLLFTTISAHDAPLAVELVIAVLLIGAAVAVALVSLTSKKDRVAAIHAVAEVLRALLPWAGTRRSSDHPPKPGHQPANPDANDDPEPPA